MLYREFLSLSDEEITFIVNDIFHPKRIENIDRDTELNEITCDITTIWKGDEGEDDFEVTDELTLRLPECNAHSLSVDFSVNKDDIIKWKKFLLAKGCCCLVNYSPPSRCTRLEEGASIRRSLVSRLRGVKFTGRFLTVQTLQTILCSELTPAFQPVLRKLILYSQYILSECCI